LIRGAILKCTADERLDTVIRRRGPVLTAVDEVFSAVGHDLDLGGDHETVARGAVHGQGAVRLGEGVPGEIPADRNVLLAAGRGVHCHRSGKGRLLADEGRPVHRLGLRDRGRRSVRGLCSERRAEQPQNNFLGPYSLKGTPAVGLESTSIFISQSSNIAPIDEKKGQYLYIGDQWFNPNHGFVIGNSSYVIQPVTISDGTLTIKRADNWRLTPGKRGGW
jgi:hypothetical protein